MTNFSSTKTVCVDRKSAEAYLSALPPSSTLDFFKLNWELNDDGMMRADGGNFTVLHNPADRWWEVGYRKHYSEELVVERFYSMEQAIAYIVLKWL